MDYLEIISDKYNLNRETGKRDCFLLFNDHMHRQITEYYKDAWKEAANAHPWYYPDDYTDGLSPRDSGLEAN